MLSHQKPVASKQTLNLFNKIVRSVVGGDVVDPVSEAIHSGEYPWFTRCTFETPRDYSNDREDTVVTFHRKRTSRITL